jgi:hypothetical protein
VRMVQRSGGEVGWSASKKRREDGNAGEPSG